MRRVTGPLTLLFAELWIALAAAGEPDGVAFFRRQIEPVLKAQCYSCHSPDADELQGGLRVDFRDGLLRGGERGPAIIAGKAGPSLLIQALRHEDGLAMPPDRPRLPDPVLADFEKWVEMGAPDPRVAEPTPAASLEAARQHWAFQPVIRPALPGGTGASTTGNVVDAFLREQSTTLPPRADKRTLIRRVTFGLTGLPPTPEEVATFLSDESPEAYERLVDRLLASPHFGERAAQPWLDVVRFAETEGYEYDLDIPGAWRYRDYVIAAFNSDKPFDRFLTEQLAGDELHPEDHEYLTASIFHRLGPVRRNAGNPEIALSRNEVLTERTDILGSAILGLTVGCARCHNHKREPISQRDYYQLQAYLAATYEHNIVLAPESERQAWELATQKVQAEIARVKSLALAASGDDKTRLTHQVKDLEDRLPPPLPSIPAIHNDFPRRTAIHVLKRGVWEDKGQAVHPRPLRVLEPEASEELSPDEKQPRTRLARWLTSPHHPLTARVIVNRVWQQHFGVGLVKTSNDLGTQGDRPTCPKLLDWLAARLIETDWHLKSLHRLLVLSDAYQQATHRLASADLPAGAASSRAVRYQPRRLSAEELRDAMLAVSGKLNRKAGGPSVLVPVDHDLVALLYKPSQWVVSPDSSEHDRRSIYLIAKRNLRLPFFDNLDAPALQTSCARRESSTHPPQALELLNGALANDLARAFAARLERDSGGDAARMVQRGFQLALGRPPTTPEMERSLEFLRQQPASEFALALFNLNEFVYVR